MVGEIMAQFCLPALMIVCSQVLMQTRLRPTYRAMIVRLVVIMMLQW